jgi:hypothetical protein
MLHTWQAVLQFTEIATYFHNGSQALMHHRGSGRAVAPVNIYINHLSRHTYAAATRSQVRGSVSGYMSLIGGRAV